MKKAAPLASFSPRGELGKEGSFTTHVYIKVSGFKEPRHHENHLRVSRGVGIKARRPQNQCFPKMLTLSPRMELSKSAKGTRGTGFSVSRKGKPGSVRSFWIGVKSIPQDDCPLHPRLAALYSSPSAVVAFLLF